jgi:hypothetical protein
LRFKKIADMRVLLLLLFWSLSVLACKKASTTDSTSGDTPPTELQMLEDKVLAIHDEVMPKMKDINDITTQLRAIKSGIKETPEGKLESPDGFEQVMGSLKLAEQGMWDWMKAYSDTKAKLKEDQLKSFYEKELITVTKVKEDMLSSIEKAQAWLAAYPNK